MGAAGRGLRAVAAAEALDAPDRAALPHTSHVAPAPQELATLRKARSLLLILIATCDQTLLALQAASNVLDTQLATDLEAMIARSNEELRVLSEKIAELQAAAT